MEVYGNFENVLFRLLFKRMANNANRYMKFVVHRIKST